MQYKFKQKIKKNQAVQVYKVNIYQTLFVQFVSNQVELCTKNCKNLSAGYSQLNTAHEGDYASPKLLMR